MRKFVAFYGLQECSSKWISKDSSSKFQGKTSNGTIVITMIISINYSTLLVVIDTNNYTNTKEYVTGYWWCMKFACQWQVVKAKCTYFETMGQINF